MAANEQSQKFVVSTTMVITSLGIAFPVFADTGAEVDTVEDKPSKSLNEKAINEKIN